jgi:Alginate lyase
MQPGRSFSRRTVLRLAAAVTAVAAVAAGFLVTPNPWLLRHVHSGSSVLALRESDGSGSEGSAGDGSGSGDSAGDGSAGDGSWDGSSSGGSSSGGSSSGDGSASGGSSGDGSWGGGSGSGGSAGGGSWGAGSGSDDSGAGAGGSAGGWSGSGGSGGDGSGSGGSGGGGWSGNGDSGGGWSGGSGSGGGGWSGGGGSGGNGGGDGWWGSGGSNGSGSGGPGYGGSGYGGSESNGSESNGSGSNGSGSNGSGSNGSGSNGSGSNGSGSGGSGYGGSGSNGSGSGGSGYGGSGSNGSGGCRYPSQILDLKSWKLTLPTGSAGSPKEIVQPALATFASTPWFQPTSDCAAVVFRSAVDGVTTKGSSYPRSELREMSDGGSDAAWSSASGTHTMTVTESFNRLPQGKPELVGAQIHDDSDDISVFRLEGSNLYITDGNNPHYKLVTSDYALGTRYQARYVVSDGTVKAYYNGQLQTTLAKSFSNAYFKAGAYTQANCERVSPCDSDNYGETMIYNLEVSHG